MSRGIYQIRNISNGKIYVGSSNNMENRFSKHKGLLNNSSHWNGHLQSSWNKYGEDCFAFEVIENVSKRKDVLGVEQFYLDCLNPEYNIEKIAGKPPSRLGTRHSKETKLKMSASRTGKKHSEETKRRIGAGNVGKIYSDESRMKMSLSKRGENSHSAKLTEKDVLEIREVHSSRTNSELGKMFGVGLTCIQNVRSRTTWRHI